MELWNATLLLLSPLLSLAQRNNVQQRSSVKHHFFASLDGPSSSSSGRALPRTQINGYMIRYVKKIVAHQMVWSVIRIIKICVLAAII